MTTLPVSGFALELSDSDVDAMIAARLAVMTPPPGWGDGSGPPAGLGVRVSGALGPTPMTTATAYESTGLVLPALAISAGEKVNIRASGIVGHTSAGAIVTFAVFRDGVAINADGDTIARCVDNNFAHGWSLELDDEPPAGEIVYSLAWRVFSGTAYLGRRPDGTNMNVNTFMSAQVV